MITLKNRGCRNKFTIGEFNSLSNREQMRITNALVTSAMARVSPEVLASKMLIEAAVSKSKAYKNNEEAKEE